MKSGCSVQPSISATMRRKSGADNMPAGAGLWSGRCILRKEEGRLERPEIFGNLKFMMILMNACGRTMIKSGAHIHAACASRDRGGWMCADDFLRSGARKSPDRNPARRQEAHDGLLKSWTFPALSSAMRTGKRGMPTRHRQRSCRERLVQSGKSASRPVRRLRD